MNGRRLSIQETINRILSGDLTTLAKTITLVESQKYDDKMFVNELIGKILPYTGKSFRIGFTGIPGAGKSSFIEYFGKDLCESGKKVAVLAIDPSSPITGGSILGDSTRMTELLHHPLAFIRPSPSNGTIGGVHANTYETILLCEAAGFDYTLIETVGIGQSEGSIREHVDCMVLLTLARGGDDLQGIKRGILELVDFVVINKCDGELIELTKYTASLMKQTMKLVSSPTPNWKQVVMPTSTESGLGMSEFLRKTNLFLELMNMNSYHSNLRIQQNRKWFHRSVKDRVIQSFFNNENVKTKLMECEEEFMNKGIDMQDVVVKIIRSFNK
ncbi:methylmalonyl Co-A mutase-associated GTPase MeaB [Bacillus sp. JJ664]